MSAPTEKKATTQVKGGLSYADAGVDIDAGNALVEAIKPAVRSTRRPGSDTEIGGFGGLFDLKAAGFKDPVLVAANDGVGTKLRLAIEAGIHTTVGIDLVAMCVNDLVVQGAEPLFFLDYFATGKLDVAAAAQVITGIAQGCRIAGCALIGGETAEMPGMYKSGDYDLAGFAVGAAERGQLLPHGVAAGDVLFGLASSGVHSNGFSLVRKIIEVSGARLDQPAPFDSSRSLGEILLEPTRIYVKPLLRAIRETGGIKAMAHITGGGFVDNIPRVLPQEIVAHVDLSRVAVSTGIRLAFQGRRRCAGRDAAHLQLWRRNGDRRRSGKGFRSARIAGSERRERSWNSAHWKRGADERVRFSGSLRL